MSSSVDFSERSAKEGVDSLFVERWSPRAFTEHKITQEEVAVMIDAARWSPSSYNHQPWRFYTSSDSTFEQYLDTLVEANQVWAKNASVLGFIVGKQFVDKDGSTNHYAAFDSGAAWMAMTLQARLLGYHTHGMGGYDQEKAQSLLELDEHKFKVLAAFAIGKIGEPESLPEGYQKLEKPSARLDLQTVWPSSEG